MAAFDPSVSGSGGRAGETVPPRSNYWMLAFFIVVVIALVALAALYLWCEKEKLDLRYPAFPYRCVELAALSDAGIQPATRIATIPQPDISGAIPPIKMGPPGDDDIDEFADVLDGPTPPKSVSFDPQTVERVARWDIAAIDGNRWASSMRRGIALTPEEQQDVPRRFKILNQLEGVLGFYRLAVAYLGRDAIEMAKSEFPTPDRLRVQHCPGEQYINRHWFRAYTHFRLIDGACRGQVVNPPDDTQHWRDKIREWDPENKRTYDFIDERIEDILTRLIEVRRPDLDPTDPINRADFCAGLPDLGGTPGVSCGHATKARQALKLGDAAQASGNVERARACWIAATKLAQTDLDGAEAAMVAQRRLQAATSTCKPTREGLARISRDYKARTGDLIRVRVLKHALKALGHYDGPLDDRLSEETRSAITRFQAEREEDQTGTLTPEQTTMLICSAAESTRDVVAETTLGVMYTIGLGVGQNIDQAHDWLTEASSRKHPDATYNLAIMYGTGIILNSYRLCDVPRSPEQADRYLQEAAYQGHPEAQRLYDEFGPGSRYAELTPRERWAVIEMQLEQRRTSNALYSGKLYPIGTKCAPNRSVR